MAVIPLSRAKPPFRVTFDMAHGFEIRDVEGSYVGERPGARDGPTCAEIAARLSCGEGAPSRGRTGAKSGLTFVLPSYALVAAGALMLGAKIWGNAPIPWWFALLPFGILCLVAGLLVILVGGIAALVALGIWVKSR